jgi:hypothetical protein
METKKTEQTTSSTSHFVYVKGAVRFKNKNQQGEVTEKA